jgi:chemotaxis protein methyltransferase CheR
MGLHFPSERLADLERGIRAASVDFGFKTVESCIAWLLSSTLSPAQSKVLASHLTIGETYFFRDKKIFELIEGHVLPAIINARRGREQHIRIWSAACSSGEEAYSLAILLTRIIPDLEDWNISILATDIAPQSLKKASEGIYGEWSFRDTPHWIRDRYFRKNMKQFEIAPHIRKMVSFSYLNLAEDPYPAIINATNAMDIIFCRNVLMYFSRQRTGAVLHSLSRCLVDGGWLVIGPIEIQGTELPPLLHPIRFPGAVLYRKGTEPEGDSATSQAAQKPLGKVQKNAPAVTVRKFAPAAQAKPPISTESGHPVRRPGMISEQARQLADQGKLAEALALCKEAIQSDKLNPALHYLQANILQEIGNTGEAAAALKRALYLDQDSIVAHFALGHLMQRQGRYREAEKHLDLARSLLQAYGKDEVPPEAEGMSAGRLLEMISAMQGVEGRR